MKTSSRVPGLEVVDDHGGGMTTSSQVPGLDETELHSQPVVSGGESRYTWLAFAEEALSNLTERAKYFGMQDNKDFAEQEAIFAWNMVKLANTAAPQGSDGTLPSHSSRSSLEEQLASAYGAMHALVGPTDQTQEKMASWRQIGLEIQDVLASRVRLAPPDCPVTAAALIQHEDSSTDSSTVSSSSLIPC